MIPALIYLEVNLTLLNVLNCLSNIHSYSTALGVRHKTTRTEYTAEGTYFTHARGHCDDDIDICPSAFDLLDIFIKTNVVGTCLLGSCFLIGSTEGEYTRNLTCSVRKRYYATNHLVCLTGVNTKTNVHVNRCLKLGSGNFLYQLCSLLECVHLPCFNLLSD